MKDHPVYRTAYYPPLITIPSRYVGHSYDVASSGDDISPDKIISSEVPKVYRCDLCEESNLKSEDELTEHVRANH